MSTGVLGLGSDGSTGLNQSTIDSLRAAEDKAYLDPITAEIEDTEMEIEAFDQINSKITELLGVVESFDLYSSSTNVFNEVTANTSGSSVSFDATDTSNLSTGTIYVSVSQLATKDVYQSDKIYDIETEMDSGTLSIAIGEETYDFDTTGKTYETLVDEMSNYTDIDVALEQVGDEEYRMVIKSANSGLENSLTISQSGDLNLGYDNADNHVLSSQNFEGTIDGIEYNLSSNSIVMDNGLIVSAVDTGDSSISIEKDNTYVTEQVELMATVYNELVDLVTSYTYGDEDESAVISDSSAIRSVMSGIKDMFYNSYGLDDEESAFYYGFSFDEDGYLEIDSSTFSEALTNNYEDIKELFVGYAEKEGLGTQLKSYLDELNYTDGLMTSYEERLDDAVETLNDDYEAESERLDSKYTQLAQQYADYTVIITQMENEFASLAAMMESDS